MAGKKAWKKSKWVKVITENCKSVGTYRDSFAPVIDTLAGILENRDKAIVEFENSGGEIIVWHTNKAGEPYREQNPTLRLINDLNRDALAYWRDLGLTPSGLKKINESALKPQKRNALTEALKDLGG